MRTSKPLPGRYLGYRDADRAQPYARFYDPDVAPMPESAAITVVRGGVPAPLLPDLPDAAASLYSESDALEDGYVVLADGGMRISVRTHMPGVTPRMIDWWFGWHGDAAAKYKLWHPRAHVHAQWQAPTTAGAAGRAAYVGRVSMVDEYIGQDLIRGLIQFRSPASFGLDHPSLADDLAATIVCARLGALEAPVDVGVLAHHVRAVPGGSEMRSRFWMGGAHLKARTPLAAPAAALARRSLRMTDRDARAVLVHCAEEMQHLARFLPRLYTEFG